MTRSLQNLKHIYFTRTQWNGLPKKSLCLKYGHTKTKTQFRFSGSGGGLFKPTKFFSHFITLYFRYHGLIMPQKSSRNTMNMQRLYRKIDWEHSIYLNCFAYFTYKGETGL